MPSETIWSSSSSGGNYRSRIDMINPEFSKMFSEDPFSGSSDAQGRRFSFNDGSDIDDSIFGLKRGSLSAVTAPAGNSRDAMASGPRPPFGAASISGGIASRHPPQESFLQKFSSVADATRDIELSNGLGSLALGSDSRRTSFNSAAEKPSGIGYLSTPQGSMNENLNSRNSRHQSISDKIDKYNSTSPIQGAASLSINSDLNGGSNSPKNQLNELKPGISFWDPAGATSFTPSNVGPFVPNNYNYFMADGVGMPLPPFMYTRAAMDGAPPAPYMVPSPPPFMDSQFYGMMRPPQVPVDNEGDDSSKEKSQETPSNAEDEPSIRGSHAPGIGLNRGMPTGFPYPFHPYPYQASPPPFTPPEMNQKTEERPASTPSQPAGKRKGGTRNFSSGKGGNHIYRSPLLEEVRSNSKGKEYHLKDIYGHAVEFTKDQHGSRFIQQKLPTASNEEKEVIFNEIRETSYELMTDVFGNYVIQKYFEHGNNTQKQVLLKFMIGHVYELSLQMYGCRVVQRALEAVDLKGQILIIDELRDHILVCAKDQNGNHVIQKSIEKIPFSEITFIMDSLEDQIYHLSTHPYGCRVIQRLLEHADPKRQQEMLDELNRFIFYLIQDQYGNYVMQHILERGSSKDREAILEVVLGSVVNFSKHKFASNVIEKCIKFGTVKQKRRILDEVMLGNEDPTVETVSDESPLALMMKDQYANYVIQKLVEGFDAKGEEKRKLVMKLRQYLKQISSKNTYGKHLASVEKMIVVAETALIDADNDP